MISKPNPKFHVRSVQSSGSLLFDSRPKLSDNLLEVAVGCRASAIVYQNTRVYGDYPLIIAINASTRQLTVQPNATPIGDRLQSDNLSEAE